jgi:hypothetical protein
VCKQNDHDASLEITDDGFIYEDEAVKVMLAKDCSAKNVTFKENGTEPIELRQAAQMAILFQAVRHLPPMAVGTGD